MRAAPSASPTPAADPVRFWNRLTGREETEQIYGEGWLRWAYETAPGRLALRSIAARPWFSRWYGWRMSRPASRHRIPGFIRTYGIDPNEFASPPGSFASFNEFFYRRLRPGSRPVHPDPGVAVFPADGRHLGFPTLNEADRFFAKGQSFDLPEFLQDRDLARQFSGGAAVFSRLCPVDYHRFHFPTPGTPSAPTLIHGCLWSVNPIALRRNLSYLWQNRRWITRIQSPGFGDILMIEIGATNVGSAEFTFHPGQPVPKGAEKGFFRFGGSAVMTLFSPGRIQLAPDLVECSARGLELYSRVGTPLGQIPG